MIATGTVTTPATPQEPQGYLWDALRAATSVDELDTLEAHATVHGYSEEGQLRRAIAKRRAELEG